ncbi:hypothetical protein KUF71_019817 [Frankliniella fusca]|uniref:RNA-directed DNA polymerase n=1 Tax=Frankliniella fusca TaxID=407009 RepID=A0AAE1GVZ7_9NEOP|nr:hypothetical protein KUF71_019817 [Frankliniella fusca]
MSNRHRTDFSFLAGKDIALATERDETLQQVRQWVHGGWPERAPDEEFKPFFRNTQAFSLLNDCILYDDRVVIPENLRPQVLQLIHSDHYGVCYSKAMARSVVWWPGIDKDVAAVVAACTSYRKTDSKPPQNITSTWPLPTKPWERLHLDYAGPLDGRSFLVMVDSYTKWPIVKLVSDMSAANLITHVRYCFADYGVPDLIVTDNGTQFKSEEFRNFLKRNGVRHLTSPPWHPASNGMAERTVKTFKTFLSRFTEGDIHTRLARVLKAMRTMPHAPSNISAAEALFGHQLPSTFSKIHPASRMSHIPTPPPLPPGTLVWALKRQSNNCYWAPGSIKSYQGERIYEVLLHDGSKLRVSVDEVQRRLEMQSAAPPPPPPKESRTGEDRQPERSTDSDSQSTGLGIEGDQHQDDPPIIILPPSRRERSPSPQREELRTPSPPILSPQTTPPNDSNTPTRGRGRGTRIRGRPKGSTNVPLTVKPQTTRSGRITKIPGQFSDA